MHKLQLAEKLVEEPDSAPSQYLITQAPANTFNQSNIGWAESSSSTSFSASCIFSKQPQITPFNEKGYVDVVYFFWYQAIILPEENTQGYGTHHS